MLNFETIRQLESIVGAEHVTTAQDVVIENSQDALKQVFPADAVVFPRTAEEISGIMRLANEKRFYVTARGGGVGFTGGAVPVRGGIVLATRRLNRILEINNMKDGKSVGTGKVELAKDGKSRTLETDNADASGKKVHAKFVYEKQ